MIGTGELLVIFLVILILFGGKKLPEFAQSLGKGIREFKKACSGENDDCCEIKDVTPVKQEESTPPKESNVEK